MLTAVDGQAEVLAAQYAAIADMHAAGGPTRELRAMKQLVDATLEAVAPEAGGVEHLRERVRAHLAAINRREAA